MKGLETLAFSRSKTSSNSICVLLLATAPSSKTLAENHFATRFATRFATPFPHEQSPFAFHKSGRNQCSTRSASQAERTANGDHEPAPADIPFNC